MTEDAWNNKPTIHRVICRTGISELASVTVHYTTSSKKKESKNAEGDDLFLTLIEALNTACNVNFELQYFFVQLQDDGNYSATVKLRNVEAEETKFSPIEGRGKASNVLQAIIDAYMAWGTCYTRWQKVDI